jgi:hypothetical protein
VCHEISQQQRNEACTALISVFDGCLTIQNVIMELERLILVLESGLWKKLGRICLRLCFL